MATRAIIGYLNPDNTITTTYNHWDGYPENLGVALEKFYSTDEKAKEIANMGYVSYIDPESGEVDAKHKEAPITVGDGDLVSSLQSFKSEAGNVSYAYLYAPQNGEWMHAPSHMKMEDFVDVFALGIDDFEEEDDLGIPGDNALGLEEGDYNTKWKKFLNEAEDLDKVLSQAMFKLQGEPKEMLSAYKDSLTNDIRLNGKDAYAEYSVEDFIEDYENYVADKMDS